MLGALHLCFMPVVDLHFPSPFGFVADAVLMALIGLVSWVELEGWMEHATVALVLLTALLRLYYLIKDRRNKRGQKTKA